MKQKGLILATLFGVMSLTACNDDESTINKNVPVKVQKEFKARYPQIKDVQWDLVKNYHVARFNLLSSRTAVTAYNHSAWFTHEGTFCQSDEDIDFDKLPERVKEAITKYMSKGHDGWSIDDCEVLSREGMASIYVIEIEKDNLEKEISIAESGEILKVIIDDDDEDEILPILIPQQVYNALQVIFPNTFNELSIMELEIDDDEIEIDVMESNRHKEILLDGQYNLMAIEYEVSIAEAKLMMNEDLFNQFKETGLKFGFNIEDEGMDEFIEIEVKELAHGTKFEFEVEIEYNDIDLEFEIDQEGNIVFKD